MKNKIIIKLSMEILAAVFIAFFSYNIFSNGKTINEVLAYTSNNKTITLNEIKPLELSNIIPVSDTYALENYEKSEYQIINNNDNYVNYRIIYRISNNVDINWFNYYLNVKDVEKTDKFNNQYIFEKDGYNEVVLYEGAIKAKDTVNFKYIMWLDSSVGNEAQNKSFSGNLVVETY